MSDPRDAFRIQEHRAMFPSKVKHGEAEFTQGGLTVREWFAGQALAGLIAGGFNSSSHASEKAFRMADAMIERSAIPPDQIEPKTTGDADRYRAALIWILDYLTCDDFGNAQIQRALDLISRTLQGEENFATRYRPNYNDLSATLLGEKAANAQPRR